VSLLNWAELDREAVAAALPDAPVVLPLGALEQHGPHLATGTDFLVAQHVVERAARDASRPVLVLPPVPFGFSHYHELWGATVSLRADTLSKVLSDIAEAVMACGARRLFIVNGHGGNRGICTTIALQMSTPHFHVLALSYWDLAPAAAHSLFAADSGSVGHAGQAETSIVAAIRPDLCNIAGAVDHEPIGSAIGLTALQRLGTTGVSGNPGAGTADLGRQFINVVVKRLAELFDGTARGEPGQPA
jgi:creatinine amidohydrolase